jgi:hypothetical protein
MAGITSELAAFGRARAASALPPPVADYDRILQTNSKVT